jgi:hypothetical protein
MLEKGVIEDTCGICGQRFQMVGPHDSPSQHETVHDEAADIWELICFPCMDAMHAEMG